MIQMMVEACSTWGFILVSGLLFFASKASGDITLTANPTFYKSGTNFSLRCDLGGEAGIIEDIYAIAIGWSSGRNNTIMAGVSDTEVPQVVTSLKIRATADGYINHTNITESHLTMTMWSTTCTDARLYYCKMTIKRGVLVLAQEVKFNYTLAEGEPVCIPPTTPTPTPTPTPTATVTFTEPTSDGSTPSQSVLTIFLYMMTIGLLQTNH